MRKEGRVKVLKSSLLFVRFSRSIALFSLRCPLFFFNFIEKVQQI